MIQSIFSKKFDLILTIGVPEAEGVCAVEDALCDSITDAGRLAPGKAATGRSLKLGRVEFLDFGLGVEGRHSSDVGHGLSCDSSRSSMGPTLVP